MKLYKVINVKNESMNGGNFNWTDYLPKNNKKGKWTPTIKNINECNRGYHITPYWNMWITSSDNKVFEVEVKGLIEKSDSVGVIDKFVCKSVRLIKQLELKFDNKNNTGVWNTGVWNTGDWNTGDRNTGDRNTGDWNTGNSNTGVWNTGDWNTGNSNTGNRNTGNSNTGDRNTGDWNSGNYNTGCFNTKEPEYYELFDKPIKREEYKKISFPSWLYNDGDWKKALKRATKKEIEKTINLPNFNYKIFEEITGIKKEELLEGLEK